MYNKCVPYNVPKDLTTWIIFRVGFKRCTTTPFCLSLLQVFNQFVITIFLFHRTESQTLDAIAGLCFVSSNRVSNAWCYCRCVYSGVSGRPRTIVQKVLHALSARAWLSPAVAAHPGAAFWLAFVSGLLTAPIVINPTSILLKRPCLTVIMSQGLFGLMLRSQRQTRVLIGLQHSQRCIMSRGLFRLMTRLRQQIRVVIRLQHSQGSV